MQCLGKLNGSECRIENIMDVFIFLSYSQFGLPFLSYYCFEYSQFARFRLLFILFKICISGHAFSHGLQFQATPEDSGGLFFELSLSFRLRCTLSFGLFTILDISIASGPFLTSFGILSQELNLKVNLANWMILICFDIVVLTITLLLVKLRKGNNSHRNERLRALLRSFMTVGSLILIRMHRDFMAIRHFSCCIRTPWASKSLMVNTACR
jgi:hypothetical protein